MPQKILFDARMIYRSGIGTYSRCLLEKLLEDRSFDWNLLGYKGELNSFTGRANVAEVFSGIYGLTEQIELPLKAQSFDLFHVPHYNAPILGKTPLIVTVHDLTQLKFADLFGKPFKISVMKRLMSLVFKKATRVIAISKATQKDLVELFGVDARKIRVIYEGPGLGLVQKTFSMENELPKKYFLYVGNLKPHKNVLRLAKAFAGLKERGRIEEELVLVGRMDHGKKKSLELEQCLAGHRQWIHYFSEVAQDALSEIYQRSSGFLMPSLAEGFGLTLLEAFQAKIPVAASRIPSHEEIAGPNGLYFDPYSDSEIENAILKLSSDASLRESLVENGLKRLNLFSWEKTAQETLALYREVLE